MYYILYLTSLCRRRNWPEPIYNASTSGTGYTCTVRVNNREYQTDNVCASETLARESAAMRAYLICRNFSVNDGMYPAGHDDGGIVQGMRVAIGSGRGKGSGKNMNGEEDAVSRSSRSGSGSGSGSGSSSTGRFSEGSWSGGSSPEWGFGNG
ncbi:uncharacterized protein N7515_005357 [Penicillium bovifimosum]|uniref:DRBM domain-containing protein n=1 Tax=Penicillium bovifimosum TaxID=126998 RepID=A0A9W9KYQ1_9EURO|nr:uncharacterized protein N7515_005357 [Penicillium bovifimosum]KAJ5129318.1 hypothetical protein N7515_005357 [Penicillium bovifimosum]